MSEKRIEWAVVHSLYPDEIHRGPWPEEDVRGWIKDAEDDGFVKGAFLPMYREVSEWKSPDEPCTQPPAGWKCSRKAPHDGPCAALPWPEDPRNFPGVKLVWVDV